MSRPEHDPLHPRHTATPRLDKAFGVLVFLGLAAILALMLISVTC